MGLALARPETRMAGDEPGHKAFRHTNTPIRLRQSAIAGGVNTRTGGTGPVHRSI